MKTITVTIDAEGGMKIATKGFKGADCEKATKELEKALGVAGDRKKTPEYFEGNATGNFQTT